jgi:TonB-linked SusC/RagA family outer membrane protein
MVVENILSYNRDFGDHSLFATGVYSFEENRYTANDVDAEVFPNDFLGWYSISSAQVSQPTTDFMETFLISQMARVNYSYDSRYLVTMTVRRDGFSGFGKDNKWGIFPSVALGWNLANEGFFPLKDLFSVLKLRASFGENGNQAIGAYQSLSRMVPANIMSGPNAQVGYKPAELGNAELGWETSRTLNVGLDFGMLQNRISGNIDYYLTNTYDLLLNRTISSIHGVTPVTHLNTTGLDYPNSWVQPAITQNIGETQNQGIEVFINSRNIVKSKFVWSTTANFSYNKNKIVSLYGLLDEEGNEVDDLANGWFIGHPIRVNYDYVWDGVWQLDEVDSAPETRNAVAGHLKLKDGNGDGVIDDKDREIIGQLDPKIMFGLNNTFSYGNFKLNIFIHGAQGATIRDYYMSENGAEIRYNTAWKNWWTPENPTNDWPINQLRAEEDNGHTGHKYEDPSFIRIKDISLSYDLPKNMIGKIGLERLRFYVTLRNMFTFTNWTGLDPELIVDTDNPWSDNIQLRVPMIKEYVFGLSLEF